MAEQSKTITALVLEIDDERINTVRDLANKHLSGVDVLSRTNICEALNVIADQRRKTVMILVGSVMGDKTAFLKLIDRPEYGFTVVSLPGHPDALSQLMVHQFAEMRTKLEGMGVI